MCTMLKNNQETTMVKEKYKRRIGQKKTLLKNWCWMGLW